MTTELENATSRVLGLLRELASPSSLRELDYQDYLQTPHWAQMKRIAKAASSRSLQPRCQLCGCDDERAAFHVHHNTYQRLGQEDTLDLIVLCQPCHEMFHEHAQLWEKTPPEARRSMLQHQLQPPAPAPPPPPPARPSLPAPMPRPPKGHIK